MKNQLVAIAFIIFSMQCAMGQEVHRIWEGEMMLYEKKSNVKEYEKEIYGITAVFNVTDPTVTVYKAKGDNSGHAVIILPGGGYQFEAIHHEGYDVAKFLADQGITGVVLKYRLPNPETSDKPELVALTDTRRALKWLRAHSDKYGIDPQKIGVMGFSAGSHLATTASLWKSENQDENPNFSVLIYGVTTDKKGNIDWFEESLYHRPLTEDELEKHKYLDLVSKDSPPAFLVHSYNDDVCHVDESTLYAEKLFEHGVQAEMHLFPKGGHGFGMGRKEDGTDQWPQLFVNWLKLNFK